jgi:hypothetical protein
LYQRLIANISAPTQKPNPIPPPAPAPAPIIPTTLPVQPTYLWDTKENARHSVRLICDEEGLSVLDKDDLTACVEVESDFRPLAIHHNIDRAGRMFSTDYGIVQVNDFWHIGPGKDFPSVDFVFTHPEACVRWMAKLFKAGKKNLWSSYNSGAYKQYLS